MADEADQHDEHVDAETDHDAEPSLGEPDGVAAGGPDAADEDVSGNDGPATEPTGRSAEASNESFKVAVMNTTTMGQLVLFYPSRDVTLFIDGEAALRIMKMFAQRHEGGLADPLDLGRSSARAGWFVMDLDEPLAMAWQPGVPSKAPRTTIDPVLAAA